MRSKKLSMILQDGTPFGLRTVELSNWNGKVVIASRSSLKKLKDLEEAALPAVYFLLGDENQVYVGETDTLKSRLANHALEKDFWKEMIAFSSPELTKTEVKYLEHVFAQRLKEDGLVKLKNTTFPKAPTMKKGDRDVMEEFVDRAADILLALGYDFIGASEDVEKMASIGTAVFCKGKDAEATGVLSSIGLLVKADSLIRKKSTKAIPDSAMRKRNELFHNGLLEEVSSVSYRLIKDQLFPSASSAAEVVLGRSANGLTEWKTKQGKTIKELE